MGKLNRASLDSLIDVTQLLKEAVGSRHTYNIDEIINRQTELHVEGKITLIRTSQGILGRSKLSVGVELVCSRCLNNFHCSINFSMEEEFLPTIDIHSGLMLTVPENSDGLPIDTNNMLDVSELIRQYILLNLPMKPLCQPDCIGIKEE